MWRPFRVRATPFGVVTVAGEITQGLDLDGHPTSIDPNLYPPSPIASTEVINYFEALNSEDRSARNRWKNCEHYKRSVLLHSDSIQCWRHYANSRTDAAGPYWTASPGIPAWVAWNATTEFGSVSLPLFGMVPLYESVGTETGRVLGYISYRNLVDHSITAMLPGIRPKLSLINSVIELKDFKSLPRTVKRMYALVGKTSKFLNRPLRTILKDLKRSDPRKYASVQTGADGYLQYQFNIAPLLSDIVGIKTAIQSVRAQLNKLRSDEAKRLTHHWGASLLDQLLPGDVTTRYENIADPSFCGGAEYNRKYFCSNATFRATMEYSYLLPQLSEEDLLLRGLLDELGVNFTPKIIWNAIPWSFVIDWVIGVNRFLDNFGTRNLEPVTNIHRYCASLHVNRTTSTSMNIGYHSPHGQTGMTPACTVVEDAYKRMLIELTSTDMYRSIESSGLNPKEFSLAGALLLSRKHIKRSH